jgi:hypothetical protein
MAMLDFKGETLTVKVTHNVISEFILLRDTNFSEVITLSGKDPIGWIRDIVYCSLRVYNPAILGEMTKWEVGDEISKVPVDEKPKLLNQLLEDFVFTTTGKKLEKVTNEKK